MYLFFLSKRDNTKNGKEAIKIKIKLSPSEKGKREDIKDKGILKKGAIFIV